MTKRTDGTDRPEIDETFMAVAMILAERSTCPDGARHGAIVTVENRIVATGYGSPCIGAEPCEQCWLRVKRAEAGEKDFSVCPAIHAEANCVAHAARHGVSLRGGTLHVTKEPCAPCHRLLRNAGVRNFVTPHARKADL